MDSTQRGNTQRLRIAGWCGLIAGIAVYAQSTLFDTLFPTALPPGTPGYTVNGVLAAILYAALLVGFCGIAWGGALGGRFGRITFGGAVTGYVVMVAGLALGVAGAGPLSGPPDNVSLIFLLGRLIAVVSTLLTGIAVARARRWHGWTLYAPLLLGLWPALTELAPVILIGRPLPDPIISVWGLFSALLGLATLAQTRPAPAHAAVVRGLVTPLALAALLLAPRTAHVGDPSPSALQRITITANATTWSVKAPTALTAGPVRLTLLTPPHPDGGEGFGASVWRLAPDVTPARLVAFFQSGNQDLRKALTLGTPVGGVGGFGALRGILSLTAGTYLVYDTQQSGPGGRPRVRGTVLTVGPATTPVGASLAGVPPGFAVEQRDFRIVMPRNVPAGAVTFRIDNAGPEMDDFLLGKVRAGLTSQDVLAYLKQQHPSGPSPATFVVGAMEMGARRTQWLQPTLTPGLWMAFSFIPDYLTYPGHRATGQPHYALGEVALFTVR